MRLTKPYTNSGSAALDESTLSKEDAQIYRAFQNTFAKKPIPRRTTSVTNPTVSKNQFVSLHCELYNFAFLAGNLK